VLNLYLIIFKCFILNLKRNTYILKISYYELSCNKYMNNKMEEYLMKDITENNNIVSVQDGIKVRKCSRCSRQSCKCGSGLRWWLMHNSTYNSRNDYVYFRRLRI